MDVMGCMATSTKLGIENPSKWRCSFNFSSAPFNLLINIYAIHSCCLKDFEAQIPIFCSREPKKHRSAGHVFAKAIASAFAKLLQELLQPEGGALQMSTTWSIGRSLFVAIHGLVSQSKSRILRLPLHQVYSLWYCVRL